MYIIPKILTFIKIKLVSYALLINLSNKQGLPKCILKVMSLLTVSNFL